MNKLAVLLYLTLFACSKKEPEKQRTEPWQNPAYLSSAAASATASAASPAGSYVLSSSSVRFALPAKEQTPRGTLTAVSGELRLGRGNFSDTKASLDIDLTSLSIDAEQDGGAHDAFTRRALEWLGLGEQVPASERARHQKARFELTSLEQPTEGKTAGSWQALAKGQLSLHGFRVPVEQPISFELSPDKVVVRSQRPLIVKLAEHDLGPRNAQGQLVASELGLLGTRIGREIRVEFELVYDPAAGGKEQQE